MPKLDRRRVLGGGTALAVAATGFFKTSMLWAAPRTSAKEMPMPGVQALFFDVFGTLVDWRTGAAREVEAILKPLGIKLDWYDFSVAWRKQYQPYMEEVRSGQKPYVKLDVIHRRMLDHIRPDFGLDKLDEEAVTKLTYVWHKLDAWKDVKPGLAGLRKRFFIASCSNGNTAIMADIARRNDFYWDAILGAEVARDFKYKPHVYLDSADALNLKPENCMMVACHSIDLEGAHAAGLKTAFIARPGENGPTDRGEPEPTNIKVDVSVKSIVELAKQLGT